MICETMTGRRTFQRLWLPCARLSNATLETLKLPTRRVVAEDRASAGGVRTVTVPAARTAVTEHRPAARMRSLMEHLTRTARGSRGRGRPPSHEAGIF